ncbi:MAG: carbohydrate ABC transporter permease [Candidatus Dormibacteraceae bacterium]
MALAEPAAGLLKAPRPRRYLLERDGVLGPALLLPSVVYLLALVGVPLVLVFLYAFSDITTGNPALHLVGLATIVTAIHDPVFLISLRNTFVITFVSQALVVVCSLVLAFALSGNFPGKWLVRFLILLPWTTPIALSAVMWLWMLDAQFSPFDWVLSSLHVIRHGTYVAWFGQARLAIGSIIALQAWRFLPLATVILMAGLTSIPQDVKEQAEIDGAGFWRRLFGVILPLLTPIMMVALLFGIVATFTDMAAVYILTSGGPNNSTQVLASWAFFKGINGGNLGQGAAVALFMFPVLLALSVVMLRTASRAEIA